MFIYNENNVFFSCKLTPPTLVELLMGFCLQYSVESFMEIYWSPVFLLLYYIFNCTGGAYYSVDKNSIKLMKFSPSDKVKHRMPA